MAPKQNENQDLRKGWLDSPPFNAITAACTTGAVFWGLDQTEKVSAISQKGVGSGWSKWVKTVWASPDGPKQMVQIAATAIEDNRMQFWGIDPYGEVWSVAEPRGQVGFEHWERKWNNAPSNLQRLAAVHQVGMNSAQVWATDSNYSLFSCFKRAPQNPVGGNTWTKWERWIPTIIDSRFIEIAACQLHNGRAMFWALDTRLALWACVESDSGDWSDWFGPRWNFSPKLLHLGACQQRGNRGAQLWGITPDYSLVSCYQVGSGWEWSSWSEGAWLGCPPVTKVCGAQQTDGTVRLWATQSCHSELISIAQTSPGGGWGTWEPPPSPDCRPDQNKNRKSVAETRKP